MKKIKTILSFFIFTLLVYSCDFLNDSPQGILSEEEAKDVNSIEALVIATYSSLGNDHYDIPFSLWPYGNVRSDDAYKGGNDETDISNFHFYEISQNIRTDFAEADGLWYWLYIGISRANSALAVLKSVDESDFNLKDQRMGEMYFLRGHFYFLLKQVFGHIPFVDEDTPLNEYELTPNTMDNDDQWAFIVNDFRKAYDLLPVSRTDVGRADRIAAAAYLAKANLFKAYRQDDRNNVTGIDAADLQEVLKYTEVVIASAYDLESDLAWNFLPGGYENGKESIFAIQYSVNDGTMFGRLNWADLLSVPMGLGCCDFHKPSQNLVNAYKTENGIPVFDGFNNSDYEMGNNMADPRLFHTVALPGLPYKYNEDLIYEESWNRNPTVYGYYASLKENVDPSCDCFVNVSPFYANSKNRIVLRYADVLLMRAEALIELNREMEALPLINQLRERAQKSLIFIPYAEELSNIALYQNGVNCNWTNDFARQAMRWERRLELAMEGNRFFDLVRWGVADQVLNEFFTTESPRRYYYGSARFTKNKDEYIPIPQAQLNFVNGIYKQNPGW